jgi:ubiquinone biosynthesis protein Coq4
VAHGWRLGKRAHALFGTRWDEMWSAPLEEVRAGLGVSPAS